MYCCCNRVFFIRSLLFISFFDSSFNVGYVNDSLSLCLFDLPSFAYRNFDVVSMLYNTVWQCQSADISAYFIIKCMHCTFHWMLLTATLFSSFFFSLYFPSVSFWLVAAVIYFFLVGLYKFFLTFLRTCLL